MKTLDEVITAYEICVDNSKDCGSCPYDTTENNGCQAAEKNKDALHYLKEYQRYQNTPSRMVHMAMCDENNPLTWDELKQMVEKPVWIEAESLSVGVCPYWKDWYIIKSFSNDEFMHCNDGFEWAKETQGRLWQAYRKERE